MKKLSPEEIRELVMAGGSLGLLAIILSGAFSRTTLEAMRRRAKKKHGAVVSEKTGKRSLGIPLDGAHDNHYEGQRHPNYNKLSNGQLLTIYEHHLQHQQAELSPGQSGIPESQMMLRNGLSVEGNNRAIEFMEISILIFEALLYGNEGLIDDLVDKYEAQGARTRSISAEKIEKVIDETISRYDYLRDLSPRERAQLIATVQKHKQEICYTSQPQRSRRRQSPEAVEMRRELR